MKKDDYIKVIEELNCEYMKLYSSKGCSKFRRRQKMKLLLRDRKFRKLFRFLRDLFINKMTKCKPHNTHLVALKKHKKLGKKVVYTCIIDHYDTLLSPYVITENTDYIVFSDHQDIIKNTKHWKFKPIPKGITEKCNHNPILINRYLKMHPKEVLSEYDLSLYIDGRVLIISDVEECFDYINDKTGLAIHDHYKRDSVYEEALVCIHKNIGNKKNIKKLIQQYRVEKFPSNYGLFEATFIASDLRNKKALEILDCWWQHFLESGTLRDQLSLPYVLWKKGYQYQDVGLLGYNASFNPKFRRLEHEQDRIEEHISRSI